MANSSGGVNNNIDKRIAVYENFNNPVMYDPQDLSLFVPQDLPTKEIDFRILEVYFRFYSINFIQDHGHKCFFMSYLLKRILRYHGLHANVKQVKLEYQNPNRGWRTRVGWPMNITHEGIIDTHCVVTVNGLILDWATLGAIYNNFGAMSPRGFIVRNISEYQEHPFFGRIKYLDRENHELTANVRIDQRKDVEFLSSFYFSKYQVSG